MVENNFSEVPPEHFNEHRPIVAFETRPEYDSPVVAIETHPEHDVHRPIVVESVAAIENRPIFVTPPSSSVIATVRQTTTTTQKPRQQHSHTAKKSILEYDPRQKNQQKARQTYEVRGH